MSTSGNNSSHQHADQEIERLLGTVELENVQAGESNSVASMRRDRAALRAALQQDFTEPLPTRRAAQFSQIVRDEIDRGLLADLSSGKPLQDHLPVSMVTPVRRSSREMWASRSDSWRSTRVMAIAATLALVGGVAWLAMQRPTSQTGTLASGANKEPRELPSWATLPARPASQNDQVIAKGSGPAELLPREHAAIEPTYTRDAATALAWARRGVLAVRITTDSPRRDRERLNSFAQHSSRTAPWALSPSTPIGIAAIPTHPWPINTGLADSGETGFAANKHPDTATFASFGLTLRPTADAIEVARTELEQSLAGIVVFERVDGLAVFAERPQSEPAPDSALDILWWKKPASQWSPRLRVPVLVEFGTPDRAPATKSAK